MIRLSVLSLLVCNIITASALAQDGISPTQPPAIARGGDYMGFPERFNRYYTDPSWRPSRIVYVSPGGGGNGASRETPTAPQTAVAAARPGTQVVFTRGAYPACFNVEKTGSGSYEEPVVFYGERNADGSTGVTMTCCNSGRQSCFNFENADYVAVDGFNMAGGRFAVRAVGADYAASQHARGIAVLNSVGRDQSHDGILTGAVDWAVFEGNLMHGAQKGDGHGIYLSNGGDWNIVRFNETHSNASSDFQVNADPASTCKEVGIAYTDPRCDAYAGTGEGGQGASDYFLIDGNYFHRSDVGPNFTSLRRSIIRNNIFGPQVRHNVSFWQETDNPKLASSENQVVNNLFVTTGRQAVQFINHSNRNEFVNNVLLGLRMSGGTVAANPQALLMQVDNTVGANDYRSNLYVSGRMDGRSPNPTETMRPDFSPGWYMRFPTTVGRAPDDFAPAAGAPFLGAGAPSPFAPTDRNGAPRSGRVDLGPIEVP